MWRCSQGDAILEGCDHVIKDSVTVFRKGQV